MKRLLPLAVIAAASNPAIADEPLIELIYHYKSESHCYQIAQHNGERLKLLSLGKNYSAAPVSDSVNIDIVELPAGWRADIVTQARYGHRFIEMKPKNAPPQRSISDKRTRLLGDICLRFDAGIADVEQLPYSYEIAGSARVTSASANNKKKPLTENVSDKIEDGLEAAEDAAKKVDRFKDLLDR